MVSGKNDLGASSAAVIDAPNLFLTPRHYQYDAVCRDFEFNVLKCIQAYGFYRGQTKCEAYVNDLLECLTNEKRISRSEIIFGEFTRQRQLGKREFEKAPIIFAL